MIHASYREGLARVLPQALLSSRPVISYDVDGAPEVVVSGETGYLVKPGDIEGLANAISDLANDPIKRQQMGERGRMLCLSMFRHEEMTRRVRQVYEEILCR